MKYMQELIIYTDGGARGNPGPAAIGIVLYARDPLSDRQHYEDRTGTTAPAGRGQKIEEIKKYIGVQTNNFAEYTALITALERAQELGYVDLKCYLDSELAVRQLTGKYKIKEKNLQVLAARVLALTNKFQRISFEHIPRSKNIEADKLVNQALDQRVRSNSSYGQ